MQAVNQEKIPYGGLELNVALSKEKFVTLPGLQDNFEALSEGVRAVKLIEYFGHDDQTVRQTAIECVAALGAPALSALERALHSDDTGEQYCAISALARIGKPAESCLLSALDEFSGPALETIRKPIILALGQIIAANPETSRGIAGALIKIWGQATWVEEKVAVLLALHPKEAAAESFSQVRDLLNSALADKDPNVVRLAAEAVGFYGNEASELLPKLASLLGHPVAAIGEAAASSMARIGGESSFFLRRELEQGNFHAKHAAAVGLAVLGGEAWEAVELLTRTMALVKPSGAGLILRRDCAVALASIEKGMKDFKPNLGNKFPNLKQRLQESVKNGLRSVGASKLFKAGARIFKTLSGVAEPHPGTPMGFLAVKAEDAVEWVGKPTLVTNKTFPTLFSEVRKYIDSPKVQIRLNTLYGLKKTGHARPEAESLVRHAMQDENPVVRIHAAKTMSSFVNISEFSISSLAGLLTDPEETVALVAADALYRLSAVQPTSMRFIRNYLEDLDKISSEKLRASINQILGRISRKAARLSEESVAA